MHPRIGPVNSHDLFVALGVLAAVVVFVVEARRRGQTDERLIQVVAGGLVGGAILMRLGTWAQHWHLRENASLAEQWAHGNRSILGGLLGAWIGVHVAKRLSGYRLRTGDLFAPAVALGMGVGRIGCLLAEPTRAGRTNWSFAWEIAFHLAAFVVLWGWLRHRRLPPGTLFVWYVAAYAVFRFLVEFWRGNEVAWMGLTRPQLFLLVTIPIVIARIVWQWRSGAYRGGLDAPRSFVAGHSTNDEVKA
ncbi:prolipoprotein diacylglyceryl transferase [Nocardioides montaniterrae]